MALVAPSAPKNFYVPSLEGLKNALEAQAGSTKGQLTLLSAMPTNIDDCWAEVGAGGVSGGPGTLVLGYKELTTISEVVAGTEEGAGEPGYKLDFGGVDQVEALASETAVAMALIVGVDTFSNGTAEDVRYIVDISDLMLNSGTLYNIPAWSVEIAYGTNAP